MRWRSESANRRGEMEILEGGRDGVVLEVAWVEKVVRRKLVRLRWSWWCGGSAGETMALPL